MSNPSFPSFFLPQDITRQNRLPREQMKGWHQKQLSSLDSLDRNSLISSKTQRNIWLWIIFSSTLGNRRRVRERSKRLFSCLFNFALHSHLYNCRIQVSPCPLHKGDAQYDKNETEIYQMLKWYSSHWEEYYVMTKPWVSFIVWMHS